MSRLEDYGVSDQNSRMNTLMLLGSAPAFPSLLAWASAKGIKATVITSPDQAGEVEGYGVRDAKVVEKFGDDLADVAISFGARWVFSQDTISRFGGRLLNAHGTRLPMDRGGGGFSWRIMRGDRIGALRLHKIDAGLDTGLVVASEDYVIPRNLRTPAEVMDDYHGRLGPFVIGYLEGSAQESGQPEGLGTYYPRLHTPTHSWIDWSWEAEEIERFILAFDDPFPGARTHWRNGVAI